MAEKLKATAGSWQDPSQRGGGGGGGGGRCSCCAHSAGMRPGSTRCFFCKHHRAGLCRAAPGQQLLRVCGVWCSTFGSLQQGLCWPCTPSEAGASCQSIHTQMVLSHQSHSVLRGADVSPKRKQRKQLAAPPQGSTRLSQLPSCNASRSSCFRQGRPSPSMAVDTPTEQQHAPSSLLQSDLSPCPKGCS